MLYWSWDFKNYTGEVASLKNNIMHMISLVNSELRILALLQLLSISVKSGLQSQCSTSGEEKTPACRGNAAESTDLVSLEEREKW